MPDAEMPHNDIGAERSLLGSMLRNPMIIKECSALVREDQFHGHANGKIFAAMVKMDMDGMPVDLSTVTSQLLQDRQLDEAGGPAYIVGLWGEAPCAENYFQYAANIRNAADRRHQERMTGKPDGTTIVGVITAYFQDRYRPAFRRGSNLFSDREGREITGAEACKAPTSDLLPALHRAADYPRDKNGEPNRASAPHVFRSWAPIAWADLLAKTKGEEEAEQIAEKAADQFAERVKRLILTPYTLAHTIRAGDTVRNDQQRRTLYDWCRAFAKPGGFRDIRGLRLYCRLDEANNLHIAIAHALFGQIGLASPCSDRTFGSLCEHYGLGIRRRGRSRMVELTAEIVAELACVDDDDDDDVSTRTRPREGTSSSSSSSTLNQVKEEPAEEAITEGRRVG